MQETHKYYIIIVWGGEPGVSGGHVSVTLISGITVSLWF